MRLTCRNLELNCRRQLCRAKQLLKVQAIAGCHRLLLGLLGLLAILDGWSVGNGGGASLACGAVIGAREGR